MKGICLQLGGKYLDTKMERARAYVFRLEENRDPLFPPVYFLNTEAILLKGWYSWDDQFNMKTNLFPMKRMHTYVRV